MTYPGPGEVLGGGPGQGGQVIAGPRQQRRVVSVAQGRQPAGHTVPARRGLQQSDDHSSENAITASFLCA